MAKTIIELLDELEPLVRQAFFEAVRDIKSEAQMAVIVSAIERRDVDSLIRALNLEPEFFSPLDDALRAAYLEGGRNALAGLPVIPDPFPGAAWLRGLTGETTARNAGC